MNIIGNKLENNLLFYPISKITNIKDTEAKLLDNLLKKNLARYSGTILNFLHLLPRAYIDRSRICNLNNCYINQQATLILTIVDIKKPPYSKRYTKIPYRFICLDENNDKITLVYFLKNANWLCEKFPIHSKIIVSGHITADGKNISMLHPDYIFHIQDQHLMPKIEPIYRLCKGIKNSRYINIVAQAINQIKGIKIPEWLDDEIMERYNFLSHLQSLEKIHQPDNTDILNINQLRQRLAFDEILSYQIDVKMIQDKKTVSKIKNLNLDYSAKSQLLQNCAFELTQSQKKALAEIEADLIQEKPMNRLLQGDVGCGKTIISAIIMAMVSAQGYQTALLSPTELLAQQHYSKLKPLFEKIGINTVLLTSKTKSKEKNKIIAEIEEGKAKIIIGTHSILQNNIKFWNLALTVIDEQHRFGVGQRQEIMKKAAIPHLLLMTATPIPRTLALTFYNEHSLSQISEKPKGRKEITTRKLSQERLDELIERIKLKIDSQEKIYWICPLIEEAQYRDENNREENIISISSVKSRYNYLRKIFGEKVALVHGKTRVEEREQLLQDFKQGKIKILVATTVIEVGIDIPDATIMIIEDAPSYGLAQLHQLRGRVGRSELQSSCVLLYSPPLSETGSKKLDILCRTNDGFEIANKDLELRGEGDILGTRQSGYIPFSFVDASRDIELIKEAKHISEKLNIHDPKWQPLLNICDFQKIEIAK